MDDTLLKPNGPETRTREGRNAASDIELDADHADPTGYEELVIEPPSLPLHMTLNPPVEYDGKSYKELIFDFESLIGKDFQVAERTFNKLYKASKDEIVMPEMKHLFACILAAQVADVPHGLIMKLPRRYYAPLRQRVLKACGSSPDEENE